MKDFKNYKIQILLFILFATILSLHSIYYLSFISDDALISLRYVDRFLNGQGLTWDNYHPVEGYSNLLWIIIISIFGSLGFNLITISRVLGILFMMIPIITILYNFSQDKKISQNLFLSILFSLFFLTLSSPISVWAIGGLETPLLASLFSLSIFLNFKIMKKIEININYIFVPKNTAD
jgi:hypothetical protein